MNANVELPVGLMIAWVILFFLVTAVIHIAFAYGVWQDALRFKGQGRPLSFVSPGMWGWATLLGGLITATIYWAMHHSILVKEPKNQD